MKKLFFTPILVMLCVVFLASCKKSSSTGSSSADLVFQLTSDNPTVTVNDVPAKIVNDVSTNDVPANASVTWTSGIANVSSFRLVAHKNGKELVIASNSASNVDIFAINPSGISALIDTGKYSQIKVRVVLSKTASGALALVMKGYFTTKGGTKIPLEFDLSDETVIEASAEDVVVDGTKDLSANFKFHLNKLLANISSTDIDHTTRDANNNIIITSTVNTALYNHIKQNLTAIGEEQPFEKHDKPH